MGVIGAVGVGAAAGASQGCQTISPVGRVTVLGWQASAVPLSTAVAWYTCSLDTRSVTVSGYSLARSKCTQGPAVMLKRHQFVLHCVVPTVADVGDPQSIKYLVVVVSSPGAGGHPASARRSMHPHESEQ